MSEEINEDNCVLSEGEMRLIDECFREFSDDFLQQRIRNHFKHTLDELFQKIKKLNEMAKEKQK